MSKINKIILIILISLILLFVFLLEIDYIRYKNYQKQYNYLNTNIIINIQTNYFKKDKIFNEIEEILKKYDKLTSTKQEYEDIVNLYKIRHNFIKDDTLVLDKDLYNLIKYGINLYEKTNGLIDISKGNVIEVWDGYLTNKIGVPINEELKISNNQNIDDVVLLNNYQIKNNKVNINLDYIVKGYVLELIQQHLKNNNTTSYYINMDELIVISGDKTYKVGLKNPDNENLILKVVEETDKTIAQTTYSQKYYDYANTRYHSIINPKTLYPSNYFKSVWVITNSSKEAEILSKTLFMMDIENGKKYIKNINNIKVIWQTLDNEIITN